jgi:CRP/FNR family transcriptional regulator, nitrogen fixation regulation protein
VARTVARFTKSPARADRRNNRLEGATPDRLFYKISKTASFPANKTIFKKGDPAQYLYKVKSGCIRAFDYLDSGRRRIYAFYFPGDYFGLETSEQHKVSAEAVTPSSARLVKRKVLAPRAARNSNVGNLLLHITTMELQRIQNHNLLLLKSAQERLLGFFHEMQKRNPSKNEIDLPMSRDDIADYLDLTAETISRTLTRLKNASIISMLTRQRFVLRDTKLPTAELKHEENV